MRYRACLPLALLAVIAACASATDGPTEPARFSSHIGEGSGGGLGDPPPPPIDTGGTDIDIQFNGGFYDVAGRYFANRQGTNAWIAFVSSGDAVASPGARLQYNEKNGKTQGTGLLTFDDGSTLNLSRVRITLGSFGSCPTPSTPTSDEVIGRGECGSAAFTVDGGAGSIRVRPRPTTSISSQ